MTGSTSALRSVSLVLALLGLGSLAAPAAKAITYGSPIAPRARNAGIPIR